MQVRLQSPYLTFPLLHLVLLQVCVIGLFFTTSDHVTVRVSRKEGKLIANPSKADLAASDLSLLVAATADDRITFLDVQAHSLPVTAVTDALSFARDQVSPPPHHSWQWLWLFVWQWQWQWLWQ